MANRDTPDSEENDARTGWRGEAPEIAGATHVGVVRRVNQDAFGRFDDPERGEILLVVADGLGGHRGGEVASRMAVDEIEDRVRAASEAPRAERLRSAIEATSGSILAASRKDRTLDGMGTTVVAALLCERGESYVAHAGDSRLYRIREERIESVTEDHSLVATLVREGVLAPDEAREDPRRNQILRALGVREEVEVDVAPLEWEAGDLLLLCSDGLHGMIEDDEIRSLALAPGSAQERVEALVEAANDAGGTDNVTCVLAVLPARSTAGGFRRAASRLLQSTRAALAGGNASAGEGTGRGADDRSA